MFSFVWFFLAVDMCHDDDDDDDRDSDMALDSTVTSNRIHLHFVYDESLHPDDLSFFSNVMYQMDDS
jgi:hypothetical protein